MEHDATSADDTAQQLPDTAWATLHLRMQVPPRIEHADLMELAERLESLGALMMELDEVGGVEVTRPDLLGNAPHWGLVIYTTPAPLEAVQATAEQLAQQFDLQVALTREVHLDDAWRDAWKQYYQPITLGDGVMLIRPSWIDRSPGDPALEIVLDPGRAFGTGLHESTRLCMDALCGDRPAPARVLDLGCGSGMLALIALRRFDGAHALALDFDAEATDTTVENAEINGLSDRVQVQTAGAQDAEGEWDLVLANIRPDVLIPHADAIAARVAPGGRLLLSGILGDEATRVQQRYDRTGLQLVGTRELNDWTMLEYARA